MRLLCSLLVVVLAAACGSGHKPDSVRKYCVLTQMPFQNAQQLHAIHDRGIKLFEERKPYRKTYANQRVITAATSVVTTAGVAALQAERPKLFPGQPKGLGMGIVVAELMAACRNLPKDPK